MSALDEKPRLSICIPTFNRAVQLRETLESIILQITPDCEIVISDNASTDETQEIVRECANRFGRLRYCRQPMNVGPDRNFDRVIQLGHGEYCWLKSDDDVLKPGAVKAVLNALQHDFSLVLVNFERRDSRTNAVLLSKAADMEADRIYEPWDMDRLIMDAGAILYYCGSLVIKRAIWITRDREQYYDSMWIHIGVMLQSQFPAKILVLAAPLVSFQQVSYMANFMEIALIKLPWVVWSLPISELAKNRMCRKEPWRDWSSLLLYRATGCYSHAEYRRLIRPRLRSTWDLLIAAPIVWLPRVLANCLCVVLFSMSSSRHSSSTLAWLRSSPFHVFNLLRFWRKRPAF